MNYALRLAIAAIALTGPLLGDTRKICQEKTLADEQTCLGTAWNTYQNDLARATKHYNDCMDPTPQPGSSLGGCYYDALQRCGSDDACLTKGMAYCDSLYKGPSGVCANSQNSANAAAEINLGTANDGCVQTYTDQNLACPQTPGLCDNKDSDCISEYDVGPFCVDGRCSAGCTDPWDNCHGQVQCCGSGGGQNCDSYEVSCPADSQDFECYDGLCDGSGCCESYDPIVIDVTGDGYSLTSPSAGVQFDMSGTGRKTQVSWTSTGSDNAFLALDRNGNGKIDDGTELFSNFTPQPGTGSNRNGYNALAVYDEPRNGGNGDGWIDSSDAIYSKLRLWIDRNHNGISEPSELYTLPQKGIKRISLQYEKQKWLDAYNNVFRYRAEVIDNGGKDHWAYDILLHQAK